MANYSAAHLNNKDNVCDQGLVSFLRCCDDKKTKECELDLRGHYNNEDSIDVTLCY